MSSPDNTTGPPAKASAFYDPKVRGFVFQALALIGCVAFIAFAVNNAIENISARKIASGFGFLGNTAGFAVNQALIDYAETSNYGRVYLVGLLNTLLVAVVGIVLATLLGFAIGVARLSSNWIVRQIAYWYVEIARNLPLLFQILFWYLAVLGTMPQPRQSVNVLDGLFINNRGIIMPKPLFGPGWDIILIAALIGLVVAFGVARWAKKRQMETGQQFPTLWTGLGLVLGLPFVTFFAMGMPLSFEVPVLRGFNFQGGVRITPEFAALLIALVTYTAAFIAEIVRAGIQAVSHGQTEASYSLGLKPGPTLDLVVIPQAMRVIIPPLTSQYLNLTKNSSLAVAIGYPDIVAVFMGTTLNQTGQAIEIVAMTMATYLTISLITSAFMNWYNQRIALVER